MSGPLGLVWRSHIEKSLFEMWPSAKNCYELGIVSTFRLMLKVCLLVRGCLDLRYSGSLIRADETLFPSLCLSTSQIRQSGGEYDVLPLTCRGDLQVSQSSIAGPRHCVDLQFFCVCKSISVYRF